MITMISNIYKIQLIKTYTFIQNLIEKQWHSTTIKHNLYTLYISSTKLDYKTGALNKCKIQTYNARDINYYANKITFKI